MLLKHLSVLSLHHTYKTSILSLYIISSPLNLSAEAKHLISIYFVCLLRKVVVRGKSKQTKQTKTVRALVLLLR